MLNIYFQKNDHYRKELGHKTLLLFQVGAFYEVYTKVDKKTKEIVEPQVLDYRQFTELVPGKRTEDILCLGFRDYMLEIKYLKLIQENGYTAVVYNQDSPSTNTTRSVLGIFSPGTYFDNNNKNLSNNVSCIWFQELNSTVNSSHNSLIIGMSNIDIYTGKSSMFEYMIENSHNPTTYDEVDRFISNYNPIECIIISNMEDKKINEIITFTGISSKKVHKISTTDKKALNAEKQNYQEEVLQKFFEYNIAESILKSSLSYVYAISSLIYLLEFVNMHNSNLTNKIKEPIVENTSDRMILGNHSCKQLNILDDNNYKGKLSSVSNFLNNNITSMGIRKFKYQLLNPTFDKEKLQKEYDFTDYIYNNCDFNKWRDLLKNIKDIEKLNRQIILKKINPSGFYHFYENLSFIKKIYETIKSDKTINLYLKNYIDGDIIKICSDFKKVIDDTLIIDDCKSLNNIDYNKNFEKNIIKGGVNSELDLCIYELEINTLKLEKIKDYLHNLLLNSEKKSKNDMVSIHTTEKSGMFLECTKRRSTLLKKELEKQENKIKLQIVYNDKTIEFELENNINYVTGTSSKVYITSVLITNITNSITTNKNKMRDLIILEYNNFVENMKNYQNEFNNIIEFVTQMDIMQNKCYMINKHDYCKPTLYSGSETRSYIKATSMRHVLIEHLQTNELYIANDVYLGCDDQEGILLYGTNAVGKTSLIRAIGICVLLAQAGYYVPCMEFEYNPYKSLFTRILGNDNLFKGLSTFAVEMSELRVILKMSDENSLVLGDELCSGTEHDSAIGIFVAGVEDLYKKKSSFILATHMHDIVEYDEIKEMENLKLKHMTVIYDNENDKLIYDRELKDGPGDSMYGLEVCKSLHLPEDFLKESYRIRNKYRKVNYDILSLKTSHFNNKKIKGICELCKKNNAIEVHHLQHQQNANKKNKINHMHKNHLSNLLSVCEDCHNKIHKEGIEHKKVKTSVGVELLPLCGLE